MNKADSLANKTNTETCAIARLAAAGAATLCLAVFFSPYVSVCAQTNLDRANELYGKGQLAEATVLYKKAAVSGDNPALCYFNLANAYFQLDSVPQAIVYYRAALFSAPDFFRGHLNLAIAYYSLDETGECISTISRALEIEPDDDKALLILAASYRKTRAYPQAIAVFERLLELNPQREEAYVSLAEMYRDLQDPEEAAKWLSRYPESGPNQTHVHQMLASIYEETGQHEKARFHLRKSFAKDSTNIWTLYKMVVLQEKMGNDLVALEEARRGLEQFPQFAELALLAGNLAFRNQRYAEAQKYYTIARNLGSSGGIVGLENIRLMQIR